MTEQTRWSIDNTHSQIEFKVRHFMIANVKGYFKVFDANIYTTDKDFTTAEIDVFIDATSINTNNKERDEHLIGADFFDTANYKQITFKANNIEQTEEEGVHDLWGDLTIRGFTKNIKFQVHFGGMVKDPWGEERAGFNISGKIKRSDWGLVWNSTIENGGLMVADEISISCEIELINTTNANIEIEIEADPINSIGY